MVNMMRYSDIIVIGAGMSGLMSAITAAEKGSSVTVISRGAGVLSIGSGTIDVLGYHDGKIIRDNPLSYIDNLPKSHPYQLIGGSRAVKRAMASFRQIVTSEGLSLLDNNDNNTLAVTVIGTLRPTYITTKSSDATSLLTAKKVVVVTVEKLKDCQPKLVSHNLKKYKSLSTVDFVHHTMSSPFSEVKRALNCIDFSRYVEKPEGLVWFKSELEKVKSLGADVVLLPPICGLMKNDEIYSEIVNAMGLNVIEMVSMPPAVGGLRIRQALISKARKLGVKFIENCEISSANVTDGKCNSVIAMHNDKATEYKAGKFIIATGGIIGGGIDMGIDTIKESVFKLDIDCPIAIEERTCSNVFDSHPFASVGVNIDSSMRAIDDKGNVLMSNVYFAGKILSGYDYANEKSGYGVAIATGIQAGLNAHSDVKGE